MYSLEEITALLEKGSRLLDKAQRESQPDFRGCTFAS